MVAGHRPLISLSHQGWMADMALLSPLIELRGSLKLTAPSLPFFRLLSGNGDGEGQESTSVGICQDIPLAQPPT